MSNVLGTVFAVKQQGEGPGSKKRLGVRSDVWSERLTAVVAREVRRWRTARQISAQQLADRCSLLGLPVKRSTISNLESDYRESISIAEVLVLARALDVAPALLIAPVGHAESVEVLPGTQMVPFDAVRWLGGEFDTASLGRSSVCSWPEPNPDEDPMELFRFHWGAVSRWWSLRRSLIEPDDPQWRTDALREVEGELRSLRRRMLRLGLTPPVLPEWLVLDAPPSGADE